MTSLTLILTVVIGCLTYINGFTPLNHSIKTKRSIMIGKKYSSSIGRIQKDKIGTSTVLYMAKRKKRRKRKQAPSADTGTQSESLPSATPQVPFIPEDDMKSLKEMSQSGDKPSLDEIKAIANFQAPSGGIASGGIDIGGDTKVELPDIRDVLKNKQIKKIEKEEEQKYQRKKISRRDTKAFIELLESEPFADADDSYFEDEEYGTVSALLAEGAKSFLGIPPGPLQVGHFIGSLGIVLCAFIEYPGFPLTNLPTPLRDALQGGLGVIYLINTILAVLAVFKASERGQPAWLWAVKTFSVGGLAFDQLTQLPTLAEVEEMNNRKGARAMKNRK